MVEFTEDFVEMVHCLGLSEAEAAMLLLALDRVAREPGCTTELALRDWWQDVLCAKSKPYQAAH